MVRLINKAKHKATSTPLWLIIWHEYQSLINWLRYFAFRNK